jgi:hypothetical protein
MADAGEGRVAEVADLPVADQVGECAEGFVEVGLGVPAVDLVEADPVGAEPVQ